MLMKSITLWNKVRFQPVCKYIFCLLQTYEVCRIKTTAPKNKVIYIIYIYFWIQPRQHQESMPELLCSFYCNIHKNKMQDSITLYSKIYNPRLTSNETERLQCNQHVKKIFFDVKLQVSNSNF